MNINKITRHIGAAAIAMAAILATGCSKTSSILETIPDNASVVMHIDATQFIKNAELQEKKNVYELPKEFDDLSDRMLEEKLEKLSKVDKCIDLSNLFFVAITPELVDGKRDWDDVHGEYFVFPITDMDEFVKQLKDMNYSTSTREQGLKCYAQSDDEWSTDFMLIDEEKKLGWQTTAWCRYKNNGDYEAPSPELVTASIKKASRNPLSEVKGPCRALSGDNAISAVSTTEALKKKWITAVVDFPADGEAQAEVTMIDADGTLCALDNYFSPVSPDALSLLPEGSDFVAALGLNAPNARKLLEDLIKKYAGERAMRQFNQYLELVEPTGNVAVGANLNSAKSYFDNNCRYPQQLLEAKWTAVVQMKDPEGCLHLLGQYLPQLATSVEEVSDNEYKITYTEELYRWDYQSDRRVYDGVLSANIYLGVKGDYLYLSSTPITSKSMSDEVKQVFDNASFGAYFKPSEKIRSYFGMPYGFTASMRWEGSYRLQGDVKFDGADHGFIYDVIESCLAIDKNLKKR